ncbi:MAG: hypothetical protein HYZ85_01660 [Candidatus Omnitrophica bacterium]|nr:hypothetical protein [Candidatus Omnitrophota bacterium]
MSLFKGFTKTFIHRFVALLTAVLFSCNSLVYSSAVSFPTTENSALFLKTPDVPSSLGSVDALYLPPTPSSFQPFILIQDAHAHREAQANIHGLLNHLAKQQVVHAVTAEAASGKINPHIFDFFKDSKLNRAVIDGLAAKGELTGAELFALTSSHKIPVYGIEDEDLYTASFRFFYDIKQKQKSNESILQSYRGALFDLEKRFFNKDLNHLVQKKRDWEERRDEDLDYFHVLKSFSEKYLRLDLSDVRHQFDWPNLTRLFKVEELEQGVQGEETKKDIEVLLKEIEKRVYAPKMKRFLSKGLRQIEEISNPRKFFETLYEESRRAEIVWVNYPHFLKWAGTVILRSEIQIQGVEKERAKLEARLFRRLSRPEKEKKILALGHDLDLLKRFFSLELSREDYHHYSKIKKRLMPKTFQVRFRELNHNLEHLPRKTWKDAARFYHLTLGRDRALVENALKISSSSHQATVLIAGGFHTPGLEKQLREKQIPYAVISPRIQNFEDDGFYEKVMLGQNTLGAWLLTRLEALPPGNLRARRQAVLSEALSKVSRSEMREGVRSFITTGLAPHEELEVLRQFRKQIERNDFPLLVIFSDHHGTIEKLDAYILDAMRRALPDKVPEFTLDRQEADKNPEKKFWDVNGSLEEQLSYHGISLNDDFDGKLFFENLGDFMDRGPKGIRVFERSMELRDAGLSEIVLGNHDIYIMLNLMGFHLPWYEGYNFYGYSDVYDNKYGNIQEQVRHFRETHRETRTAEWWAERLAEFRAFHDQQQKTLWKPLNILVNGWNESLEEKMPGKGLFAQVSASLITPKQKDLWNKFRGWNLVDVYTGVRAVGVVSVQWWENLLEDFEESFTEIQKHPDYQENRPANQAWTQAISIMKNQIIPRLKQDLQGHLERGEWWWRAFEAIHAQNYTSAEWLIMDWLFHPGWGPTVLAELNERIKDDSLKVTPANYLKNSILKMIGQTYRNVFKLHLRDIYQNHATHAFLPIDMKTGEFYFKYQGVEYRAKGDSNHPSVWQGLNVLAQHIRDPKRSMKENYEALILIMSWYSDNNPILKPPRVTEAINQFGPEDLAQVNGFNRLFFGHIPFHEFYKLGQEKLGIISGYQTGGRIFDTDHGAGVKFGGRGAFVRVQDEVVLRGFEHERANGIKDNPSTVRTVDGPNGQISEEVLFRNPGINHDDFLPELRRNLETRITELEQPVRSEVRDEIPAYIVDFLEKELGISVQNLSADQKTTLEKHVSFFSSLNNFRFYPRREVFKQLLESSNFSILDSSEKFATAMLDKGIFDRDPDSDINAYLLGSLQKIFSSFRPNKTLSEKTLAIGEDMLKHDRNYATQIYTAELLGSLEPTEKIIEALLRLASPGMNNGIRDKAFFSMKGNGNRVAPYLIKRIGMTADRRSRDYYVSLLEKVTEPSFQTLVWFLAGHQDTAEKLNAIIESEPIGFQQWVSSALFMVRGTPSIRQTMDERIRHLDLFKAFLGRETFLNLIRFWGFSMVSHWAQMKNDESQKELFQILAGLERKDPAQSSLAELIHLVRAHPEKLRALLLLITSGHGFDSVGVRELLDLIIQNPAQSTELMAFLITLLRLQPVSFKEEEFVQEWISKLLHSPIEPVYYLARKLAMSIPHPTNTNPVLEQNIRKFSAELDDAGKNENRLFRYIRLELHRSPSTDDLDLVATILDVLIRLQHPHRAMRIKESEIDDYLGHLVRAEAKKEVYQALVSPLSQGVGQILNQEFLKASEKTSWRDYFLAHVPDWEASPSDEASQPYYYAKLLIQVLQAVHARYALNIERIAQNLPSAVREKIEQGEILPALIDLNETREANKRMLLVASTLDPIKEYYIKRHQATDEWGFLAYGFYGNYKEEKFDLFEQDRLIQTYTEILQDRYLTKEIPKKIEEIRKWAEAQKTNGIPEESPLRSKEQVDQAIRIPLQEILEGLYWLVDEMDTEGLLNQKLVSLNRVLRTENFDLQQVTNILTMMQDEATRLYDFFNFNFSTFPEHLALSLGRDRINPRFLKPGDEKKTDEEWAKRVRETFLGDLWADERKIFYFNSYLSQLRQLLVEGLYPWRFKYIRLAKAALPLDLITEENVDQQGVSAVRTGTKAHELFWLRKKGLPIPPLVVLPIDLPDRVKIDPTNPIFRQKVLDAILHLEKASGKIFPFHLSALNEEEEKKVREFRAANQIEPSGPMLNFSTRSGSLESMPGMMDTILDLPFNDQIVEELVSKDEDLHFVLDTYRRFLASFGAAHYGMDRRAFSDIIDAMKQEVTNRKAKKSEITIAEFEVEDLQKVVNKFKQYISVRHADFLKIDPFSQVTHAVKAIYDSWESEGAKEFREKFGLSPRWRTGVTLQAMVFGNAGLDSGTGVIFSSDPESEIYSPYGTWKWNSQGEDVVGGLVGIFQPLNKLHGENSIEVVHSEFFDEITDIARAIQRLGKVPQDIEITREQGKNWVLQTRALVNTGHGIKKTIRLDKLPEGSVAKVASQGVPVSPNAAVGRLLDARNMTGLELRSEVNKLRKWMNDHGEETLDIILAFDYVTDQDAAEKLYLENVKGLINSKVGISTHASLVAGRLGLAYVSQVDIVFASEDKDATLGGKKIDFGINSPIISIDGYSPSKSETSGQVLWGELPFDYAVTTPLPANGNGNGRSEVRPLSFPARVAISLGAYRINKKGIVSDILESNFDDSLEVAVNTVHNRIFDAYLRGLIGNPNISLTDLYGVESVERFFSSLHNPFHGRFPASSLNLKEENGQAVLEINGHEIRIHEQVPESATLRRFQTEVLIDLSNMNLTDENPGFRAARLRELQKEAELKHVIDFRGDEDPTEDPDASYHALVSPLTLASAHILRVVEKKFNGDFDFVSGLLGARPITGDSGKINFRKSSLLEYDIAKGAGSALLSLIPKQDSRFKAVAKELKAIKSDKHLTDKEKESKRQKLIYQSVNQHFEKAAQETPDILRYADEEHLSSLLVIRDSQVVVFDSQATDIRENGQVELYFHFSDAGYAAALNRLIKENQTQEQQEKFSGGTIPANTTTRIAKQVKEGDEIRFAIIGARGRIGKQLHQLLTSDPNYVPVFYLGVQDLDTFLLQFREDLSQGPMHTVRGDEIYELEKGTGENKDKLRLRNKKTGEYLADSYGKTILISYYHIQQRKDEVGDAFERRIRETLGDKKIDQVEVIFNASGFALDKNDNYYNAFKDGKNLKLVHFTSPAKGEVDVTIVRGVNEDKLVHLVESEPSKTLFCSDASCTTTALGRALIELDRFLQTSEQQVEYIRFVTHHSMTPSQGELYGAPSAGKSLRTANDPKMAAVLESTGANKVLAEVWPSFKGSLGGVSHRDGNYGGSIVFVHALVRSKAGVYPTADSINRHFEALAKTPALKGILSFDPHASSTAQIVGNRTASIFLPQFTRIETGEEGAAVTIALGYDNEAGYAQAVVDIDKLAALVRRGGISSGSPSVQSAPQPVPPAFLEPVRSLALRLQAYEHQLDSDASSIAFIQVLEKKASSFGNYSEPHHLLEILDQTIIHLSRAWEATENKIQSTILDDLLDTYSELERLANGKTRSETRSQERKIEKWEKKLQGFRSKLRESDMVVAELAAFRFVSPELIRFRDFFEEQLLKVPGPPTSGTRYRLLLTEATSSQTPRIVVIMNINGRFPQLNTEDFKAMELAEGSRVVVLDSTMSQSSAWDGYSKLAFAESFRIATAIPNLAELKRILSRFPGHVPVLLFPSGFSEAVADQYKSASAETGFAGIVPNGINARRAFSYLVGHHLPASVIREVPDQFLGMRNNAKGLSPIWVPFGLERAFTGWMAQFLNSRLAETSA